MSSAPSTPLHDIFAARGASFDVESGWVLAESFGGLDDELRVAHNLTVLADVSHWGQFTLAGKDSVKYLQGLVTNDVAALGEGAACEAGFLNVHGRFEAVCTIARIGGVLWIRTPPEATEWVDRHLGRFRLAGDFQFNRLEGVAAVTVQGPTAGRSVATVLGAVELGAAFAASLADAELAIVPMRRSPANGFDVIGAPAAIAEFVRILLDEGGVCPAGTAALEVLRIEAGRPRYLVDFDSDTVLQEIDAPEIVSFNKGCYLGQEIVARIHFQGQPAKLLRRLELDATRLPNRGDEVVAGPDDKLAGHVTSVALSPIFGPIVFGMVKRKYYAAGTGVRIRTASGDLNAVVAERGESLAMREVP